MEPVKSAARRTLAVRPSPLDMADADKHVRDSIALDAAYLRGSVADAIESLGEESMEEVDRARDRNTSP